METLLPSLLDTAASPGLSGSSAAGGSGVAASSSAGAAAVASARGDTVTFSAEALAKAAAMASNAGTAGNAETASNAGAGQDAKGQTMGGAGTSKAQKQSEDDSDATLQALKARVEQIQAEIKAEEEDDAPREEREAKLAELRMSLIEAQTAYYKAKQQAGNDQGGSASQMAAAMAGLA